MSVPLLILLLPYAIGLLIFVIGAIFHFWHLVEFGLFDFTGKLNAFIFVGVTVIIVGLTILLLSSVPWSNSIDLLDVSSWSNGFIIPGDADSVNGAPIY